MINPNNKSAIIKSYMGSYCHDCEINVPQKGSRLVEIKKTNNLNNFIFKSISSVPIKCYFIIADKNLKNLSVDHF